MRKQSISKLAGRQSGRSYGSALAQESWSFAVHALKTTISIADSLIPWRGRGKCKATRTTPTPQYSMEFLDRQLPSQLMISVAFWNAQQAAAEQHTLATAVAPNRVVVLSQKDKSKCGVVFAP
ncbi:hypothetical protein MP228_003105 [Amoeboaphelidium protococcarum]|nr:hypothetical protein MP228_003105 [Amoeboaphelidium protococcarum]